MALDTYYGFLFGGNQFGTVNDKEERLTVLRYFDDPVTYRYNSSYNSQDMRNYELVCKGSIGLTNNQAFVNNNYTEIYTYLWYGIVKLHTDSIWASTADIDVIRKHFGGISLGKGIISFVFTYDGVPRQYHIYTTLEGLTENYELPESYFVFYDDAEYGPDGQPKLRNTIEREDVFNMLDGFASGLGKSNIYNGVCTYTYTGPGGYNHQGEFGQHESIVQDFHIFYTRLVPSEETMKHAIVQKLVVDKGGRDLAKFYYPNLFKDEIREVYLLRKNNCYPISYNAVTNFLSEHPSFTNPEIISVVNWKCPLVVQNGVSDVLPNYRPVEIQTPGSEADREANKFLYYLTAALNFIDGSKNKQAFPAEVDFENHLTENGGYVQFTYLAITWRVYK